MSTETLIPLLEQIRDQQKQQLDNFEQAMEMQQAAAELQKRGRKILNVMIFLPWALIVVLLVLLIIAPNV